MVRPPCPSDEELQQFLAGVLDDAKAENLEAHFEVCDDCGARLAQRHSSQPWETTLRMALPPAPLGDPVAERLMEQVRNLPIDLRSLSVDSTTHLPDEGEVLTHASSAYVNALSTRVRERLETIRRQLEPTDAPNAWGQVGPYAILGIIGTGGMGIVFEALDRRLHRLVALKFVSQDVVRSDRVSNERFLREARTAASLRSPHVVTVYAVEEWRGWWVLVMERLVGETLQQRMARQTLVPHDDVATIFGQILVGLAHAHQQGLVHRDLKPANVFLAQETMTANQPSVDGGRPTTVVKIVDFGLARGFAHDDSITHDRSILGTPGYWSPEHVTGQLVGPVSDLFSAGCVLYELLTGRLPFEGIDLLDSLLRLAQGKVVSPRELVPTVPAPWSDFVMRLLARDVQQRFGDAVACHAEWEECVALWRGNPELTRAVSRATDSRDAAVAPSNADSQAARSRRRGPVGMWGLLLAVVVLLILVGPWAISRFWSVGVSSLSPAIEDLDAERTADGDQSTEPNRPAWASLEPRRVTVDSGLSLHSRRMWGREFLNHWGWVSALAVHDQMYRCVTVGVDGQLSIWDLKAQSLLARLNLSPAYSQALDFRGPQGHIAVGGTDGVVRCWHPQLDAHGTMGYRQTCSLFLPQAVHSVRIHPDGTQCVLATRKGVGVYRISDGQLISKYVRDTTDSEHPWGVEWVQQGQAVAVRGQRCVLFLDPLDGRELRRITWEAGEPQAMRASADGSLLAVSTVGPQAALRVYQTDTGELQHEWPLPPGNDSAVSLDFSPDQQWLAAVIGLPIEGPSGDPTASNHVAQWSLSGVEVRPPILPVAPATGLLTVAYADEGRLIVAAGREGCGYVWNAESGELADPNIVPMMSSFTQRAVGDTSEWICGGQDGSLWRVTEDTARGERMPGSHAQTILAVDCDAEHDRLVSSGMDGMIRAWRLSSGGMEWATEGFAAGLSIVDTPPRIILSGRWYEHPARLLDLATGRSLPQTAWENRSATCAATHAATDRLILGMADATVDVLQLSSGQSLGTLRPEMDEELHGANTMLITHDGALAVVAFGREYIDQGRVGIWELDRRAFLGWLPDYRQRVMSMAWHPQREWLATGGWYDGIIRIWQLQPFRLLGKIAVGPQHSGIVMMEFQTDGLVALGMDGGLYRLRW